MLRDMIHAITIDLIERAIEDIEAFARGYEIFARNIATHYSNDVSCEEVTRLCFSLRQLYAVQGCDGLRELRRDMIADLSQPMFPTLAADS